MLIESLIRRKGGTTVTLGQNTYKFAPIPPDPRHVCDVEDEDDIGTLLAIKEGYRIAKGATVAAKAAPPPEPEALSVKQQGGKTGKWFVFDATNKAASEGFASKSDADAALAAMEKAAGE